ncbi:uncharacterized protein LOC115920522 [Strongylocentrotus purpuratus]|uniref:DUF7041 domain-containing protein n=1 Tax=Strongylocentrotus purpuratus TaxID=7668 RepID=A0A7M7N8W3_STRPU|nr:uncharacterized protein LOC115920522 [Strongylocentrotus purpuratus]
MPAPNTAEEGPPPEHEQAGAAAGASVQATQGVGAVSIKLPPFWRGDPEVWFAQASAQFETRGITSEQTKYAYIIATLPSDVALEIRDILISPPLIKPYTELRALLISRMTSSEQRRVQMLLNEEELGDRKPSQLLRRMQQLLGMQQLEKGILRELFLQRLPQNVRLILASSSDALPLSELANLADKILEASIPVTGISAPSATVAAVSNSNPDLQHQVLELTKMVKELTATVGRMRSRSRSRSMSSNRKRDSSGSKSASTSELCWYHEKWGEKAHQCRPPCTYSKPAENN